MTTSTADLSAWTTCLSAAARLRTAADHDRLRACCDAVTGQEEAALVISALVGVVRGADDNGAYEAVHNAIWRFPPEQIGAQLGALLPAWLRRLRAAPHQVWRFLAPIQGVGSAALPALVAALEAQPAADRAAVGKAAARLLAELPEAAPLAAALGAGPAGAPASPAPRLRKASRHSGPPHDRAAPGTPAPPPPAIEVDPTTATPETLLPYIGVGAYRFGMSREACAAALGPAEAEKRHVALKQVEERRGPVTARFADRGLVELHLSVGAALTVAGVDVFGDKQSLDQLRAAFPGATEQRAYVNFESLGLCLFSFGKSKPNAGRFALLYDRGQAPSVRFLGKV